MAGGAGPPPVEIFLNVFAGEGEAWRASVDHAPDRRSVTFPERSDGEHAPERITGHAAGSCLLDEVELDAQLHELFGRDCGGRFGHGILRALRLRECDDIADGIRMAEQHDQPVEAERDAAM